MPEQTAAPMPRLSEDLPGPRHPQLCQACGAGPERELQRWMEHDEQDRPERVLVVLCPPCARRIIEPHPRLYELLDVFRPWPGAMDLCCDCRHRDGLQCRHPDLKANGGPGLELKFPTPISGHIKRGKPYRSGFQTVWTGPVRECVGREVAP